MVAMDETWIYHNDFETKRQSIEWGEAANHAPINLQVKIFASICWDQPKNVPIDCLTRGHTNKP